jgi:asparagine synthetase B (glutamine-hydrolysing)
LASVPSLPDAVQSLVPAPAPSWIVDVPLRALARESESGSSPLRLACADGVTPPARLARAGCELVLDGVLYPDAEADVFGSILDARAAAELVLDRYLESGPGMMSTIKGTFALILLDGRNGNVLCARDRLGQHPLFYATIDSHLALSTSADALLRDDRISREVNRPLLADRLRNHPPFPGDETYFTAIKRLPPGHMMRVCSGKVVVERYWDPFPEGSDIDWIGEAEFERVDELLAQAVVRCLRRGPTGILLSGGLDSCTIATTAADESRARGLTTPLALSLLFPIGEQDERIQRGVATGLGLRHLAVSVEELFHGGGFIATSLATSRRWPNPLFSPWHAAYQHIGLEARRAGCRAVLSGDGGDEHLLVHSMYAADRLRALDLGRLHAFWKGAAPREATTSGALIWLWRAAGRPLIRHAAREVLRRGAPGLLRAYRGRQNERLTPDWLVPDAVLRRELGERAHARAAAWDGVGPYVTAHRQPFDHPEGWMGREELFEVGRRFGLSLLTPFWDVDLIELLARTPPELLVHGGPKGPARQRLASRFPGLGFEQPLSSYTDSFLQRVIRQDGPQAWRALGGLPALTELGIVDDRKLSAIMEAAFADRWMMPALDVWTVLSVESWLQAQMIA